MPDEMAAYVMLTRPVGGQVAREDRSVCDGVGQADRRAGVDIGTLWRPTGILAADPSGSHLLVLGFGNENTTVLDIATHRVSALHVRYPYPPFAAAW